jgi:hypothetical protein
MQIRSRRLAPGLALATVSAVLVLAACVGDDPSLVSSPTTGPDGGGQSDGPVGSETAAPVDGGSDATESDAADASRPPSRLVFVTSEVFAATPSGGAGGFDNACNAAAARSTKIDVKGGKFVAWVSTATARAASHAQVLGFTGAFLMPDGTVIAQSGADLLDGTIAAFLDRDENGEARAAATPWTGTTADGAVDTDGTCADWTSAAAAKNATRGITTEKNSRWTKSVAGSCADMNPVYCFQVP